MVRHFHVKIGKLLNKCIYYFFNWIILCIVLYQLHILWIGKFITFYDAPLYKRCYRKFGCEWKIMTLNPKTRASSLALCVCNEASLFYIYIYISKSWSVAFIVATLILCYFIRHVIGYIIIIFLIYFLFLNFVDYIYIYWLYTFNFNSFNFMYNFAFTYSSTLI